MPAFVVSVPFTESASNVSAQFESFRRKISLPADQFSIFEVPGLKVGTLDTLMECSDDLNKIDNQVEVITFKTLSLLEEISGTSELAQISKPSGAGQSQCSIREYLATFRWNEAQYPLNKPLKALIQHIHESVNKGEENIRTRMSEYNEIRTKVQGIKKKSGGSLAVKPIASIVKEFYRKLGDEGPVDSEYLTTLFVAVPIVSEKDWLKDWYTLVDDLVVPGTSLLVDKDSEYCLYTVIVFKKIADKYKHLCRERRWLVRDFKSDEEVTDAELEELNSQMEQKKNNLIRWLRNTFSESYSGFIHLKAIRTFVESILRYGVPPNFLSVVFQVEAKREKDLRKQLNTNYAHLNPKKLGMEENEDALNALEQQYPYVSIKVKSSTSE